MDAEVIDRQYVRAKLRKDRQYLHSPATDTAPYHPTRIDVGISRGEPFGKPRRLRADWRDSAAT